MCSDFCEDEVRGREGATCNDITGKRGRDSRRGMGYR